MYFKIIGLTLSAYLLGAIPFGYLFGKIKGKNILEEGSKSTGTTNVIRVVGKWWGLATLVCDLLKGGLAVWLALRFASEYPWLVTINGLLAIIGHSKSVFIGFKGGKSAATGAGIILILNWQIALIAGAVVFIIRQMSGYQSVATLLGSLLVPILLILAKTPLEQLVLVVLAIAYVWVKHIPNIKRLLKGEELRITKKKK